MNLSYNHRPSTQSLSTPLIPKIFASMMYEGMLLFGVIFVAAYLFDTITQSRSGDYLHWQRQLIIFLAIGIYFILCWYYRGQTIAMKTWHIRLVKADGKKPKLQQMLLRYILCWPLPLLGVGFIEWLTRSVSWPSIYMFVVVVPFLNLIPACFTRDGQMLHDKLSGTRLVNFKKQP